MIILYIFAGAFLGLAVYFWTKFSFLIAKKIFSSKKPKKSNPYIDAHLSVLENEKNYQEYLQWLDKNGSGVPIEKVLSREEYIAEQKVKNLFR